MPEVEADVKLRPLRDVLSGDFCHQRLGCDPLFFGVQHDWRTMRVIGANKVHLMSLHPLESHPDISLDVLHHMADMESAVGVGKGSGDE